MIDEELISSMCGGRVAVSVATADMYAGDLFDVEERWIRKAAPIRRAQFIAGRSSARTALAKLGSIREAIPADEDGVPRWPTGFLGSITHCEGFCCAVVGRSNEFSGLGIDAEQAAPLPEELARLIAKPHEFSQLGAPPKDTSWLNIIFSAKEAFYKAYYPKEREFLDFCDVEVSISPSSLECPSRFNARISNKNKRPIGENLAFEGYWAVSGEIVICTASFRARL